MSSDMSSTENITPISELVTTPSQFPPIRARVTTKTDITTYVKASITGTVFLMVLLDESKEITAVVFDESCTSVFDKVQVGNVYLFSGFNVTSEYEEYFIVDNPYQIILDLISCIELCANVPDIPRMRFQSMPLEKIYNMPDLAPVETLGICGEVGPLEDRGGNAIREMVLLDSRGNRIVLNLWNKAAINFDANVGDIILVKGTRLRVHNGQKKLNFSWYSHMEINPEIPEVKELLDYVEKMNKLSINIINE